jgi:hypothetical protein
LFLHKLICFPHAACNALPQALNAALVAIIAVSWSVTLFNAAAKRGWEPFNHIVHRALIYRHYQVNCSFDKKRFSVYPLLTQHSVEQEHAPDKLDDIGMLMKKNVGQVREC